ncbi:DUF885 domain-containing protein, partial [Haliangium sp.]|uniref:DUF885 domain-containing protein n=1 Tax=Haliangium sp. TaxID=2663208 RepID=UPI003D101403
MHMRSVNVILALALGLELAAGCGSTPPPSESSPTPAVAPASDAPERFAALSRRYIAERAAAYPAQATQWGLHEHDHALRDLRAEAIAARVAQLRATLDALTAIERAGLDEPAHTDHLLLDHALRAELLELEEIRAWQRNPMVYNGAIARGLASLVDRAFAPLPARMEAAIARLDGVGAVIAAAKTNLRDVPRLWARLGAELTRGTASFLREDLPAGFEAQGLATLAIGDPEQRLLVERFHAAHARALAEVEGFAEWLEHELLPKASGDFRLGPELFLRKLRYEEHVELDIDQLKAMNQAAIRDYQAWVARVAAELDPAAEPTRVMADLTTDYPAPEALLDTARGYMEEARGFIVEHELLTLPSDDRPIVRPTPAYARTGFASMSTPGPFETVATEAYYNITTVDPAWDQARAHQHLTYFNRPGLLGITVHEAFPGHFVQLLYRSRIPSDLRKVISTRTLVEGWAHYTEQMMVDEGLGAGAPTV